MNVHGACEHGTGTRHGIRFTLSSCTSQHNSVELSTHLSDQYRSISTTTAQKHTGGPHNVALSDPSEQKHSHQSEAWLHVQSSAGGRRLMPRSAFAEEKPGQSRASLLPPAPRTGSLHAPFPPASRTCFACVCDAVNIGPHTPALLELSLIHI